jgi:hypothetical protein
VRSRLLQFSPALASRITPGIQPELLEQAALDALRSLPAPDYAAAPIEARDLQIVFRHDCL